MKLTYAVVIEQTPNNYCAYVPDVPGCIGAADTLEEMREMMREALVFHIEGTMEDGEAVPEPTMSIEQAIAYHNEPIPEDELADWPDYAEHEAMYPPRFELVEIEVPTAQMAATG